MALYTQQPQLRYPGVTGVLPSNPSHHCRLAWPWCWQRCHHRTQLPARAGGGRAVPSGIWGLLAGPAVLFLGEMGKIWFLWWELEV